MCGAPPPPVIRPPNAAADHQFVGAQLYFVPRPPTGALLLDPTGGLLSQAWSLLDKYLDLISVIPSIVYPGYASRLNERYI